MNPKLNYFTIPRRGCQANDFWLGQELREVHRLRSNPGSCKGSLSVTPWQEQVHKVNQEAEHEKAVNEEKGIIFIL